MLKDAKGYRSPYINALNNAVAAARIIGGDVIPEETPSGTILTITQTKRAGRFELFCGFDSAASADTDNGGDSGDSGGGGSGDSSGETGADAYCLSDGTLYIAAIAQALKPGRDVFRRDGDLMPRPNGWCTSKTITETQTLTFACCKYNGQYFIIAKRDDEKPSDLLPEELGTVSETEVDELFTFGQFYWQGTTGDKTIQIRQDIHSDVWYGGGGEDETKLLPLTIKQFTVDETQEDGTVTQSTKWGCYFPAECASILTVDESETSHVRLIDHFPENFEESQFVQGQTDWLDVTNEIEAGYAKYKQYGAAYEYLAIILEESGSNALECVLRFDSCNTSAVKTISYLGWRIPIVRFSTDENENMKITQINYGPLQEIAYADGMALMKNTESEEPSDWKNAWSKAKQGETINPQQYYALIGQEYGQMTYKKGDGEKCTAGESRHRENWINANNYIIIKPLVFANFGAIVTQ